MPSKKRGGLSKREVAAQKKAPAKTPAKSTAKASSSFNYKQLGITTDAWNKLGSDGQAAIAVSGSKLVKIMEKNQPLPEVLDDEEMKKLWNEAEKDPVIAKYYADEMNVAKDYLHKNLDILSSDYQMLTDKEKQDYVDAKKNLEETYAQAGTAYSGFRQQASQKQDKEQQDIINSAGNKYKSNLMDIEKSFEERFGTQALTDLALDPLKAGTTTPIGLQENYTLPAVGDIGYTPTGGVTGTQASDILKDKLQKQQDLESEKIQSIQLENIKREKTLQEAYNKL